MKNLNEQLADRRLKVRLGLIVAATATRTAILEGIDIKSPSFIAGRESVYHESR